jgi:uncharacterized phage-associated protein
LSQGQFGHFSDIEGFDRRRGVRLQGTMVDLVTPANVADFLLCESRERGELLTNLKLQKLLYYAQAWHWALNDGGLFEEDFQAWVHGPVLPSQYRRFSDYQWRPILEEVERPALSEAIENHLNEILDVFGSETAVALELMTHKEKPWREARGDLPPHEPSTARISKTTMRDYYRSLQ